MPLQILSHHRVYDSRLGPETLNKNSHCHQTLGHSLPDWTLSTVMGSSVSHAEISELGEMLNVLYIQQRNEGTFEYRIIPYILRTGYSKVWAIRFSGRLGFIRVGTGCQPRSI
jgi:hypothetical protein